MSGFPIPEVSWQFGTDFILDDSNDRISINSIPGPTFGEETVMLEISMPRLNETGSYTCNASSSPYFDSVESEPALVLVQGIEKSRFQFLHIYYTTVNYLDYLSILQTLLRQQDIVYKINQKYACTHVCCIPRGTCVWICTISATGNAVVQ